MSITRTYTRVLIKDASEDTPIVGTAGDPQNRRVDSTTDRDGDPVQITTREEAEATVNTPRAMSPDAGGGPC